MNPDEVQDAAINLPARVVDTPARDASLNPPPEGVSGAGYPNELNPFKNIDQ